MVKYIVGQQAEESEDQVPEELEDQIEKVMSNKIYWCVVETLEAHKIS